MPETLASVSAQWRRGVETAHRVHLAVGACRIRIESNAVELVRVLRDYYAPFTTDELRADVVVTAIEAPPPPLSLPLAEWPREPGKTRRKEQFAEIPGGRVVHKVRTDMQFAFGEGERLAIGPCLANQNQVINFVNAQYMTWLLDRGWLLCHAAAVARSGRAIAIAGLSGGGKSTLALHLLRDRLAFVSNDRVLMRKTGDTTRVSGIPKLPRINPGTALHHPDLHGILSDERRHALASMSRRDLWELEEKYDVDVGRWFDGVGFELEADLRALVVLNWSHDSADRTRLEPVVVAERRDLLAAVVKSPGPFHLPTRGIEVDDSAYVGQLGGVSVWEATGRVDFEQARTACLEILGAASRAHG